MRPALLSSAVLVSHWEVHPESPIRRPVPVHFGTGPCGSERGACGTGFTPTRARDGVQEEGRVAHPRPTARARDAGRAAMAQHGALPRQESRSAGLVQARARRREGSVRRAPARPGVARADRPTASGRPARRASTREGVPTRRDLPCVRQAVLRAGTQGVLVRVAALDEGAERPVPRALPDGLVGAAALRARGDTALPGRRGAQVLRVDGPRLEPVELQALVRDVDGLARFDAKCGRGHGGEGFLSGALLVNVGERVGTAEPRALALV